MNQDIEELGLHIANPSNQRDTIARIPIPHARLELYHLDDSLVDTDIICKDAINEGLELNEG